MEGILFNGFEVEVHPEAGRVGGAWTIQKHDNKILAWDPNVLQFFCDRMMELDDPRILDIGASTGSFCLLVKRHPRALVTAFEPAPKPRSILKWHIAHNNLVGQIAPCRFAVTDKSGPVMLKIPNEPGMSGLACIGNPLRFKDYDTIAVVGVALDDLTFVSDINMIKIDTEGAEMKVLRGAEKLIRSNRPSILYEENASNMEQFDVKPGDPERLLRSWGYHHFESVGREDIWATYS